MWLFCGFDRILLIFISLCILPNAVSADCQPDEIIAYRVDVSHYYEVIDSLLTGLTAPSVASMQSAIVSLVDGIPEILHSNKRQRSCCCVDVDSCGASIEAHW